MLNHYNPFGLLPDFQDLNDFKDDLTLEERLKLVLLQVLGLFLVFIVAIILCAIFSGCTTARIVEQHHHHHYEADTLAVKAAVDSRMGSWHEDMTQYFDRRLEEYSASWLSHEGEKETVTELITVSTDSLGRSLRTEQRTITRDITRELLQTEHRITQEYEQRLHAVVDSVSDVWSQRFDSLAAHQTSDVDHQASSTPVGDTRPWYKRWWDGLRAVLVAVLVAAVLWLTRKWWLRLLRLIMSK